jgi:hypothetical protein
MGCLSEGDILSYERFQAVRCASMIDSSKHCCEPRLHIRHVRTVLVLSFPGSSLPFHPQYSQMM